jgi:hypothetical protein
MSNVDTEWTQKNTITVPNCYFNLQQAVLTTQKDYCSFL